MTSSYLSPPAPGVTAAERDRNRRVGDYQVIAELLGNGGRSALGASVPFLEGTRGWKSGDIRFKGLPTHTRAARFFARPDRSEAVDSVTPGSGGDTTIHMSVLTSGPIDFVGFYDDDGRLTAFGAVA